MQDLVAIRDELRRFAHGRDWEQFHTPKNLAMALVGEVGELVSIFQWVTPSEFGELMNDPKKSAMVRDELADVFTYLVRLSDVLGVDLGQAFETKLEETARRYSVERARGSAEKIHRESRPTERPLDRE